MKILSLVVDVILFTLLIFALNLGGINIADKFYEMIFVVGIVIIVALKSYVEGYNAK